MMRDQNRAKIKRLWIWFAINLVIFVVCYLNYRHQLKHRYLYKILNAGLCLSRAAAMVINFNLLLVWLPMCKYTLTRLAVLACKAANRQRKKLHHNLMSSAGCQDQVQPTNVLSPPLRLPSLDKAHTLEPHQQNPAINDNQAGGKKPGSLSGLGQLVHKLNRSLDQVIWRIKYAMCMLRIKSISSFLIAVDNCTSLHTICATTITIASVIHTVAHLMNVINFSNNFDPLLGDLNMAEHKGQNPFQLLVSVPGITGCLMMTILLLMSLSSISIIRNSSFDLFQIFHRLSVLFVILLILHPSSHILKEQNNVSRHHPDLCYNKLRLQSEQTLASSAADGVRDYNNSAPLAASSSTGLSLSRPLAGAEMLWAGSAVASSESVESSLAPTTEPVLQSQMARAGESLAPKNRSAMFAGSARQWEDYRSNNKTDTSYNGQANSRNSTEIGASGKDLEANAYESESQSGGHDDKSSANISVKQKREILQNDTDVDDQSGVGTKQGPGPRSQDGTRDNGRPVQLDENSTTRPLEPVSWKLSSARFTINHDGGQDGNVTVYTNRTMQDELCLDISPTFVAQSSICWYVLGAGLSCYLLDLFLRRLRRSKSSIQLVDACTDAEGNLIELVLSNNHKRFAHWLPGQYVYLNCPQIATYEWHPFTISSMDNDTKQFTLHIKTGGDWTRKLRYELESRQQQQHQKLDHLDCTCCSGVKENSMSLFFQPTDREKSCDCPLYIDSGGSNKHNNNNYHSNNITSKCTHQTSFGKLSTSTPLGGPDYSKIVNVVATFDCYNHKTGQLQVECRRFVHLAHPDSTRAQQKQQHQLKKYANDCVKIDLDNVHWNQRVYSIRSTGNNSHADKSVLTNGGGGGGQPIAQLTQQLANLDLFIDGPFHSPFERLLEQQVSVCIANGVGWTAFSAVFQQITNELSGHPKDPKQDWWSQWKNFPSSNPRKLLARGGRGNLAGNTAGSNQQNIVTTNQLAAPTVPNSANMMINKTKLSLSTDTKLHLMVIVTTIEQLRPFYKIVLKYFNRMREDALLLKQDRQAATILSNPIQEVTAFITRSTRRDSDVIDFCRKENLSLANLTNDGVGGEEDVLRINDTLMIRFGRPDFDMYLNKFSDLYKDNLLLWLISSQEESGGNLPESQQENSPRAPNTTLLSVSRRELLTTFM